MPGHYDRFKDQPKIPSSGGGGPAGMGSPPPSQNFGSNVRIGGGGNPGDAGGSTSGSAFSPQDMNIQPAPSPTFSPQDMNIPPAGGGSGSGSGSDSGSGSSDTSTTTDDKKTNIFTDP